MDYKTEQYLKLISNAVASGDQLPSQYIDALHIEYCHGKITAAEFHSLTKTVPSCPALIDRTD